MKMAERRQLTERQIKSAFVALLKSKPVEKITVTEVAKLANIDRKTFYLHYDSVPDIYIKIEKNIINETKQLLVKEKITDWKQFLRGLTKIMLKDKEFYMVIWQKVDLMFIVTECTNILNRLLQESLLANRKATVKDRLTIRYAAFGLFGVYSEWLQSPGKISLEEIIDIFGGCDESNLGRIYASEVINQVT